MVRSEFYDFRKNRHLRVPYAHSVSRLRRPTTDRAPILRFIRHVRAIFPSPRECRPRTLRTLGPSPSIWRNISRPSVGNRPRPTSCSPTTAIERRGQLTVPGGEFRSRPPKGHLTGSRTAAIERRTIHIKGRLTGVPVDGVHPLHVSGHHFDARLFPAVLLVEQMVGLQVQHARGLPVVHEPAQAFLPVLERVVTTVVHHQIAAGLVTGHRHQHLPLIVRVVPVGLGRGRFTAATCSRLPAPVHDGPVRRPYQYHALRVVRLIHQPFGGRPTVPVVYGLGQTPAARRFRAGHVGQPVRDAVVRRATVPGRRFDEVLLGRRADGAVE